MKLENEVDNWLFIEKRQALPKSLFFFEKYKAYFLDIKRLS
jgi:hypothetical protein